MPWIQLTVDVRSELASQVEVLLEEAGALSVSLADAADDPLYEPPVGAQPLWPQIRVTGLFEAEIDPAATIAQIAQVLGTQLDWQIQTLVDQDWERVWLKDFRPLPFGTRLWVCPHGWPTPQPDAIVLWMDPGLAFGTGTHPTTALCLEWLGESLSPHATVIDYGCGSGILGLAALRLGAAQVWAVDNDPQALWATLDNASRNQMTARSPDGTCSAAASAQPAQRDVAPLWVGPPAHLPSIQVDVLLANILARTIVELAPHFATHVKPSGVIVLSGILTEQAQQVMEIYRPWFDFSPATIRDGWARLTGVRRVGIA